MARMDAGQRSKILSDVVHLAEACPHDGSNPAFCPLHEVRKMGGEEKETWARALSDQDLNYLALYHQVCLQWRAGLE